APPALCPTLLCELPLSGAELEPVAPGGREGRVASRRAVPARRLHRDEPASPGQEGRRLLQRARHGGAVHQGGQARGQVDAAVVHDLPGQRGAPPTPRAGLQPGQLPPHARTAGRGRAAVADEPAGKGDEDRREGDRPRPLRDLPDGGGGGAARAVRPHLGADRKASSARPSPMLTLEGCNGRQPGVELRPECVLGCRSQAERRSEVSRTPWQASRRPNTLACDVARAVSKPRNGDGPHPSGKCRFIRHRLRHLVVEGEIGTERLARDRISIETRWQTMGFETRAFGEPSIRDSRSGWPGAGKTTFDLVAFAATGSKAARATSYRSGPFIPESRDTI